MLLLNRDGSLVDEPQTTSSAGRMAWRLYAEIPARPLDEQSRWIERLIRASQFSTSLERKTDKVKRAT